MSLQEVLNQFTNFFNRDNITLALSIFGSAGTLISAILSFIRSRKRISITVPKLYRNDSSIWLYVLIENNSRLPISVNSISMRFNDELFYASQISQKILEVTQRTGNTITDKKEYFSIQFPISLPALSGTSGYLYFEIPATFFENSSTQLCFQVGTNRGMIKKTKLPYTLAENLKELY